MLFDKEEFAKRVKVHSGAASRDEGSTTINSLCEYIIRETMFSFMDLVQPALEKVAARNEEMEELEDRINELENQNRFLMGLITFNKDRDNGEDGRHENAKRGPKASRVTA